MKKSFIKTLLILSLFLISINAFAYNSMRKCTILPITDSVNGAIGFEVFQEIEEYLLNSSWCKYRSNSDILNIFTKYQTSLKKYLENPKVIKLIAGKLKVGSLIRIDLQSTVQGIKISLDILGDNGEDLYFREKTLIKEDRIPAISQTIKNWLNVYEKNIPYDGLVMGVLGDQVTIDFGKRVNVSVGQEIIVKREIAKKRHPLLKQIVSWKTQLIGVGRVVSLSTDQSIAMIKTYHSGVKANINDWIILEKNKPIYTRDQFNEEDPNSFGKLGVVSIALNLADTALTNSVSSIGNEYNKFIFGINVDAEMWITRNYFVMSEFSRNFGKLTKSKGNASSDTVGVQPGEFKLLGGYKYLPLGFFNGPQFDFYGGYGWYSYTIDKNSGDGLGDFGIHGFVFGLRANAPIYRAFRVFLAVETLPFAQFNNDSGIYGSTDKINSLEFEFGVKFQYTPRITLDGAFEITSSKATFSGGTVSEVQAKSNTIRLGASVNF
jgi:hypothetical protein